MGNLRSGLLPAAIVVSTAVLRPAAAQTTHTVESMHINFLPPELTVRLGDTVQWLWVEGFHNVESGEIVKGLGIHDGRFRSGDPDFGLVYDLSFDRAFVDAHPALNGIYPYYCVVHSFEGMTGVVEVVVPGDADRDLDVDLDDYAHFGECSGGPAILAPPPPCRLLSFEIADLDLDGDVDLADFAGLQNAFTAS
jgi:plastocyanin